jgi:sialic acid synthase SpsE
MQGEFDCHVGYSDHTLGIEAALTAVSLGARVIEKHFTLRHDYSDFRDHQLSADPGELAQLVQGADRIITLLGDGKKEAQACEVDGIEAFRRSIALNRDMNPGETIQWEDLVWLRPGTGFRPGDEELVVGKQVTRKVLRGELLLQEMLEEAETNKCA